MADPQTPLSPRLLAWDQVITAPGGVRGLGDAWSGFAEGMRFRIGASVLERKVPFAVGTDAARPITKAMDDLVALVQRRVEGGFSNARTERMEWRERSFGLRGFKDGSLEKQVARVLLGSDPNLDAGILESWLVRGGAGGPLIGAFRSCCIKGIEEEIRLEGAGSEPTAFATLLALQLQVHSAKAALKQVTVKGLGYESLDRTVGVTFGAALALAAEDAMAEIRERGLPLERISAFAWVPFATTPMSMVGIRPAMLRQAPNPYVLPRDLAEAIDALVGDPLSPVVGGDCAEKVRAIAGAISKSREGRVLALDSAAIQEVRGVVLAYLREFDVGREPRHDSMLSAVLLAPTLNAALKDGRTFEEGRAAARSLAEETDRVGSRGMRIASIADHFDRAARRNSTASEDQLIRGIAQAWLIWRLDRWTEEKLDLARARMFDRAKEFGVAELKTHYEGGKVYRIAPDDSPILLEQKRREDAHLFLDLKGFTKMVATTKELSTAEFLKHEFYVPILSRALAYREAGRRIELNNLLGDAVSFSGDVSSMVYLAEDIRVFFDEYAERAKKRGLAQSSSGRIEAGLFVAFGTAAETILIDSYGWGDAGVTEWVGGGGVEGKAQRIKVAISEKINESARGTARNGAVWQRMVSLLEGARQRQKKPELELPWTVYVDTVVTLSLPPAVIAMCQLAMGTKSASMAGDASAKVAELLKAELVEGGTRVGGIFSRTSDIFNVGRALSREAVDAFLRETATTRVSVEKEIEVGALPPEFHARWVFPEETLSLIVSYDTGKARMRPFVFRRAGELTFRGFEGVRSTGIFELVDAGSEIYRMLEQHYLGAWRPGAR